MREIIVVLCDAGLGTFAGAVVPAKTLHSSGGVGLDATVARAEGREGEAATNTSEAVTAQRELENTRSSRSKRRVDGKIILSTYFDET